MHLSVELIIPLTPIVLFERSVLFIGCNTLEAK